VKSFAAGSSGVTSIEYALIAGIVSIAIVGGATAIGTSLSSDFSDLLVGFQ